MIYPWLCKLSHESWLEYFDQSSLLRGKNPTRTHTVAKKPPCKKLLFRASKIIPTNIPTDFSDGDFIVLDSADFTMVSRSLWSEKSILIDKYMPLEPKGNNFALLMPCFRFIHRNEDYPDYELPSLY